MKNKKIEIKNRKTSLKPFIYQQPSISAVTTRVLILLLLQVIMLFITKSYAAIFVILASTIGSVCAHLIYFSITKEKNYSFITTICQGIMIGMLLPHSYPVFTVFFISFFTFLIYKYVFDEKENFWINIVAVTVLIAYFIGTYYFPGFLINSELFPQKNPSVVLIQNGAFPIYDFDTTITGFLNNYVFSHLKVNLPEGFVSLFWDTNSIIPAFRFNLLTIIASIVLFSENSFSVLIPSIFLIVYCCLVRLFFPMLNGGEFNQGDVLLALLTSGTLFFAVFIIQWFGTNPMTIIGKIIYAVFAGINAFVIIGCGTSPIGIVYITFICNILNLLIRFVEEKKCEKNIEKKLNIINRSN